jgi:hypothetical protein
MVLVLVTIAVFQGSVGRQRAEDPRSSTRQGAGALGQLLSDEGIRTSTADRVDEAVDQLDSSTTLVIARPGRLTATDARQLMGRHPARVIRCGRRLPRSRCSGFRPRRRRAGRGVPTGLLAGGSHARRADLVDDPLAGYLTSGLTGAACY